MGEVVFHIQELNEGRYGLPLAGTCGDAGLRVGDVLTELVWHVILPGDFFSRHRDVVQGEVLRVHLVVVETETYSVGSDGRTRFEAGAALPSSGYGGVRLVGAGSDRVSGLDLVADRRESRVWSLRGQRQA